MADNPADDDACPYNLLLCTYIRTRVVVENLQEKTQNRYNAWIEGTDGFWSGEKVKMQDGTNIRELDMRRGKGTRRSTLTCKGAGLESSRQASVPLSGFCDPIQTQKLVEINNRNS